MVSEFSPATIIVWVTNINNPPRDRPDDFVDVLRGFKLKCTKVNAYKAVGVYIVVRETPYMIFTLEGNQHQANFCSLDVNINLFGPVFLKRHRMTPARSCQMKAWSLLANNHLDPPIRELIAK